MSFRKTFLSLALVTIAFASACAGVCVYRAPEKKEVTPRLQDVFLLPPAMSPTHLYPERSVEFAAPGAVDANPERSRATVDADGLEEVGYFHNHDDSTRDVFYQRDGKTVAMVQDFYPSLEASGARVLKSRKIYADDGVTLRSEVRFRRDDGSQEYDGHLLADGSYQAFTLFRDGNTAETETLTKPSLYETNHAPKLIRFRRWQEAGHGLVYLDELNKDGGSRDIKEFDSQGLLAVSRHIGLHEIGSTVTAYFPHTTQVAMHSETFYFSTDATFFRQDGTVDFKQVLDRFSIGVTYFDVLGKTKLFHQDWSPVDLEHYPNDKPHLWQVTEYDDQGRESRFITFSNDGVVSRQIFNNLTLDGVLYRIVTIDYDETGKFRLSSVIPADNSVVAPPVMSLDLSLISTQVHDREKVAPDLSYHLPLPQQLRRDRS